MSYFEVLPYELLEETIKYLPSPKDLINLDFIKPFDELYKDHRFWFRKFLLEFPKLDINNYDVEYWNSPYNYKRLYNAYLETFEIINSIESIPEGGRFLVTQNPDNIPILDVAIPEVVANNGIVYNIMYFKDNTSDEYSERYIDERYNLFYQKEITKNKAINLLSYMLYNKIPLDNRSN